MIVTGSRTTIILSYQLYLLAFYRFGPDQKFDLCFYTPANAITTMRYIIELKQNRFTGLMISYIQPCTHS